MSTFPRPATYSYATEKYVLDTDAGQRAVYEALLDAEHLAKANGRPAKDANEEHAAQALVQLANMDPDKARQVNDAGFSKSDVATGHTLARRWEATGELTGDEWEWAVVVANKYRRQVGPLPEAPNKSKGQPSTRTVDSQLLDSTGRFSDLQRQGFMRPAARPSPASPETVACDACMNWHAKGKHTADAATRKTNRKANKASDARVRAARRRPSTTRASAG